MLCGLDCPVKFNCGRLDLNQASKVKTLNELEQIYIQTAER